MEDDAVNASETTPVKPHGEQAIIREAARRREDYQQKEREINQLKARIRVAELDKQAIELQVKRERLAGKISG